MASIEESNARFCLILGRMVVVQTLGSPLARYSQAKWPPSAFDDAYCSSAWRLCLSRSHPVVLWILLSILAREPPAIVIRVLKRSSSEMQIATTATSICPYIDNNIIGWPLFKWSKWYTTFI